ncbi:MAG TPA: HEPN domain-containing protein [Pirellulales bacterium]|nr:HEPN domain-containing protein [Pirellulales bacterium]
MHFARVEDAIKSCKAMLGKAPPPELESYLVSYLLIITYAQYEEIVQKIVEKRVARIGPDRELHAFTSSYLRNKKNERRLGKIYVRDLGEILGRFGKPCKAKFVAEVANSVPQTQWDSIVTGRHIIAHQGAQPSMRFPDFETAYAKSQQILNAFARACGLTAQERGEL